MPAVAVVPARAGSRGLPNKNLAQVQGLSLVQRAVRCAVQSRGIGEVIISSDDETVLADGVRAGALAVRRPSELATDTASTRDVVVHALQGRDPSLQVVVLQPTSPLRAPEDVEACLDALATHETVTTVSEVGHPAEWIMDRDSQGKLVPLLGWQAFGRQRQPTQSRFQLNGAVYTCTLRHLRAGGDLVDASTHGVVMPRERSVDIDDRMDLLVAQALADHADHRP